MWTLRGLIPGPTATLGRVLDAIAHAGLFRRGAVLIGTAAYQCYPPLLGAVLPSATVMTQDTDLATAELALEGEITGDSMTTILQRADASFAALPGAGPEGAAGPLSQCRKLRRRSADTTASPSRKDLAQAAAMVAALRLNAPFELDDALDDARGRGRDGWARPIERSLSQISDLTGK